MLLNCGIRKDLIRVPWTTRRSNQSILKEISPEYSLEGLMLKLKLQYFGHLMRELTHWKRPWCWEGLGTGGEGDDRGWDGWMISPTRWTWVWVSSGGWWWTGRPGVLRFMGSQRVGRDWTELYGALASALASVLPMNIQDWFLLGLTAWISLLSKGLSNTTVQKHQFFSSQLSLGSNSHIHTWLQEKP